MAVDEQNQTGVLLGDGVSGLLSLPSGSVDLLLSDLPSGETAAQFDRASNLLELWPATWRALKEDGVAVLMAHSFAFAARVVASQEKFFRYDLVWEKSLAVGFLNARTRPLRAHEFVLVFSKKQGTFNPQFVETGVPINSIVRDTVGKSENWGLGYRSRSRTGATDRYPRSVLHFGSLPTRSKQRVHPQQKPDDLLRMLVRQYSNVGELVADPYAGSGSTLLAAATEGRRAIGWDISERFARVGGK